MPWRRIQSAPPPPRDHFVVGNLESTPATALVSVRATIQHAQPCTLFHQHVHPITPKAHRSRIGEGDFFICTRLSANSCQMMLTWRTTTMTSRTRRLQQCNRDIDKGWWTVIEGADRKNGITPHEKESVVIKCHYILRIQEAMQ